MGSIGQTMKTPLDIQFRSERPDDMPVYEFIKRELRDMIDSGELTEGDRVPSEFDLVKQLGVSRNQTRQALRDLELEGYLLRQPGKGSFVAPAIGRIQRQAKPGVKMVAMPASGLTSNHRRAIIQAFARRMMEDGIHTLTNFLEITQEAELGFLEAIRDTGVLGLAIWVRHRTDDMKAILTRFRDDGFPLVLCDRHFPGVEADFVGTDNEEIGYLLTRALIERGHTRIGFLTHGWEITTTTDRFDGYKRALVESGLPVLEGLRTAVGYGNAPAEQAVQSVLSYAEHPTALVCVDDGVARRTLEVLKALDYGVPKDMALAAVHDDSATGGELPESVITARQAADVVGRETAEVLLARIASPRKPIEKRWIRARELPEVSGSPDPAAREKAMEGGDADPRVRPQAVQVP